MLTLEAYINSECFGDLVHSTILLMILMTIPIPNSHLLMPGFNKFRIEGIQDRYR